MDLFTFQKILETRRQRIIIKFARFIDSFLCDTKTDVVPKSQIGFITGIIIPRYYSLLDILPQLKYNRDNVYKNMDLWRNMVINNSG